MYKIFLHLLWVALCLSACSGGDAQGLKDGHTGVDGPVNPGLSIGAVPVHRLTRFEYNNTVHDLLATALTPGDAFPADPVSDGFDNSASNLTLSPQLYGLYNTAATALANEVTTPQPRWNNTFLAQATGPTANPAGAPTSNWGWNIIGEFDVTANASQDDTATITVVAGAQATNAPAAVMSIKVDGTTVTSFTVTASMAAPQPYVATAQLSAGKHTVGVSFDNKVTDHSMTATADSELAIGSVAVASTVVAQSPGYKLLFVCDPNAAANPNACWQNIITTFMARAWRRPLSDAETTAAAALWKQLATGVDTLTAFNFIIRSTLLSSSFIYRAARPGVMQPDGTTLLDDYDLANRLSYFLWGSMPDPNLLQAADSGALRTADGIATQVRRMLADPKVQGLRTGFAPQWLGTRDLATAAPDPNTFPSYDAPLKAAFTDEANLFFADYLTNNLPVSNMLTPSFGYLNNRLAQHYNLPSPSSDTMVRTNLSGDDRRGLLTQGGWLTAQSVQTRSSPVKRGRFIMENLLCKPVPPPPPGVPPLPDVDPNQVQTQRQILGQHTANTTCAACHNIIDPPGFAVEVFDGIGAARTTDNGLPIDATGTLNGKNFNGPVDLAGIIAADPTFEQCVVKQIFTYALGRAIGDSDGSTLAGINAKLPQGGDTLDQIIIAVTTSEPFRLAPSQ